MDSLLRKKVSRAFDKNPYLLGSRLRWELESGTVVLHGTVPSYFLKQMAQETVRTVEGVSEIQNRVLVSEKKTEVTV